MPINLTPVISDRRPVTPKEFQELVLDDPNEMASMPKSGVFVEKWTDLKTKTIIPYEDGKLHGEALEFNQEGLLVQRSNYKKGLQEGLEEIFSYFDKERNYQISVKETRNYQAGKLHGEYRKEVYDFGVADPYSTTIEHYKDGLLDGEVRKYYKKNIKEITNYKAGRQHGLQFYWPLDEVDRYGITPREDHPLYFDEYRYDNRIYSVQASSKEGMSMQEIENYRATKKRITDLPEELGGGYRVNHLNGEDIDIYKMKADGSAYLASSQHYFFEDIRREDDHRIKERVMKITHTQYWENGNVKTQWDCIRETGKRDGPCESFYENGKTRSAGYYSHDKLEGLYTEYYPNGNKKASMQYSHGQLHGEFKEWNKAGILITRKLYMDGKVTKILKAAGKSIKMG